MRKSSQDINGLPQPVAMYNDVQNWPDEGLLLEIGTLHGKSAVSFAEAFEKYNKTWNIHTIDFYKGSKWTANVGMTEEEYISWRKENGIHTSGEEQRRIVLENLEGWDNIKAENANFFPGYVINIQPTALFYDGNHDYEPCKQALDKFKDLDLLYVDDYCNRQFPGTVQACHEHAEEQNKDMKVYLRGGDIVKDPNASETYLQGGVAVITTKEE